MPVDPPDLSALLPQLQELIDRQAIYDCLKRYTRGVDRHDDDLIRSAFWPDAQIAYGRSPIMGPEEFIPWVNAEHATLFEQNQHHITGQTVEFDGDVAHVESYVLHFLLGSARKQGPHTIGSGRYIERYDRRGAEWRIAVREYIPDALFVAEPLVDLCPEGVGCRGKRDRSDLSYLRPLEPLQVRPQQAGKGPNRSVG